MPTRQDKPVALGTWSDRSRPAPSIDERDFEPVDAAARAAVGFDVALHQVRYQDDPRADLPGVALITRPPAQRRTGPDAEWSVDETARAADTLLGAIAGYCLGRDGWDRSAEAALAAAVADLATPLRVLTAARTRLTGSFGELADARLLTAPVLAAARRAVALVGARFRAVPAERPMPWMDLRVTAAQRARALRGVVDAYDELLGHWYGFAFVEPPPADRARRLADLRAALPVEAALERCERVRDRCRELCAAELVARPTARLLVRDLRTAVAALERGLFTACLA